MRASLKQAAIVLAATFVLATPASAQGWYERSGPVYDGPGYGGPYYTGPYKGAFARLAYPDESRCLMERRELCVGLSSRKRRIALQVTFDVVDIAARDRLIDRRIHRSHRHR